VTDIRYRAIGVIHSPHKQIEGTPIQPSAAEGVPGRIELEPQYVDGLRDLAGFSHLILLYHLDRAREPRLLVTPFLDSQPRGVFATRAPSRPNPIGLSVVKLVGVEGNLLHVENVDILDGTPLLDIKPYAPPLDNVDDLRLGWLEEHVEHARQQHADDRFQ